MTARAHIVSSIERQHGSVDSFTRLLKLRFLLRPLRYDGDVDALLSRSSDAFDFGPLVRDLNEAGSGGTALACIRASSGEVRQEIGLHRREILLSPLE